MAIIGYARVSTADQSFTTNADPAKKGNGDHYVTNASKVADLFLADGSRGGCS